MCLQVPARIALVHNTRNTGITAFVDDEFDSIEHLGARLLRERAKGTASPFHAWINMLPSVKETMSPVLWPAKLTAKVQYVAAATELRKAARRLKASASQLTGPEVGLCGGAQLSAADKLAFRCPPGPCAHPHLRS